MEEAHQRQQSKYHAGPGGQSYRGRVLYGADYTGDWGMIIESELSAIQAAFMTSIKT